LRKSLNVNLPDDSVTSEPKSPLSLDQLMSSKLGAGNCCVVTRPSVLLMPVGPVKSDMPSSVSALRLTSAKRTRSSTWLLRGPSCTRRSDTTSSRLPTKPAATSMARSARSFLETAPESTIWRPLLCAWIASPGNSVASCRSRATMSRFTVTSNRRMPPARSHTNIEIVPGALPLTSSWLDEVTSASATSALVSETRVIGRSTSSTTERPTSSVTGVATGSTMAPVDEEGTACTCASTVPEPSTARMQIQTTACAAPVNCRA
jgi:hypothetical protein